MPPTVSPRNAASLLLVQKRAGALTVLMGRRPPSSSFIPDAFVFPGGKADAADRKVEATFPLIAATERAIRKQAGVDATTAHALANAAVRETFEETGILLARRASFSAPGPGTWRDFEAAGLAPDLSALRLIARAITPVGSPVRYHARFFVAEAERTHGVAADSPELLDLDWYPLREAVRLPIIDVTRAVLEELSKWGASGQISSPTQPSSTIFIRYRGEITIITRESHS
jgi:8-oxo-dGTP pyrophosphatase MutT (NUDIX family)